MSEKQKKLQEQQYNNKFIVFNRMQCRISCEHQKIKMVKYNKS